MKNSYTPQRLAFILCYLLFLFSFNVFAQVGIGTTNPNANALLDIDATTTPGGLLLPRVALTATNNFAPLAAHVAGMTVYNTATAGIPPNNVTPGYYYNDGGQWVRIAAASVPSNDWTLLGNAGTVAGTNFLGTTDDVALRFRTFNGDRFEISSGVATSRGRLRSFDNGSAVLPTYSWTGNIGTGIFQQAANVLGFSTNGTEKFRIPNADQVHAVADGTAALPFYSWTSDTGIGMYRSGTNTLAFSTAAAQRMRLLANGQVIINNTAAPLVGDRFTVQGIDDEFAINGYATGAAGVAIYGESAAYDAVVGNAARFGVVGLGLYGTYGSGTTYGSYGIANNATGMGMRASNQDASGTGLLASGNNMGGTYLAAGSGIAGTGFAGVYGNGATYGSYGTVNNATGYGVRAVNSNALGTGILATGNNATGAYLTNGSGLAGTGDTGVYGFSTNATGTGIIGKANTGTYIVIPAQGSGLAGSGGDLGVFGYAGNGGVANGNRGNHGGEFVLDADDNPITTTGNNGNRATAILAGFDNVAPGYSNGAGGTGGGSGNLAINDSYYGGYFSGGSESNGTPSYAYVGMRYKTNTNGTGFATGGSGTGRDYKIIGTGVVSTLIKDENGTPRVLFAPEAPEVVFQDYGIGQLVNGEARILMDPVFKRGIHVDAESPLKVYVTLEGDCNGVYVTNKSADGFTVKELQGGTSNAPFSWQIVASRADTKNSAGEIVSKYVGVRLPEGPGPLEVKAKKVDVIKAPLETTVNDVIKTPVVNTLNDVVKRPVKSIGASATETSSASQPAATSVEVKAAEDTITKPSKTINTQENK